MMTLEEMRLKKEEMGLSYTDIARRSGVPLATVQKVLSGITKSPRYQTRLDLESVFKETHVPADPADAAYKAGKDIRTDVVGKKHIGSDYVILPEEETDRHRSGSSYDGSTSGIRADEKMVRALALAMGRTKEDLSLYTNSDREKGEGTKNTELILGALFDQEIPGILHQAFLFEFASHLREIIHKYDPQYAVMIGPADLVLTGSDSDGQRDTVVQPDIFLIREEKGINGSRIEQVPDLIVEILTEKTRQKDLNLKYLLYLYAGVQEYWCLDPERQNVIVYDLQAIREKVSTYDLHTIKETVKTDREQKNEMHEMKRQARSEYSFDEVIPIRITKGECLIDMRTIRKDLGYLDLP